MAKTIQQQAFLFSHEITKRLPRAADRLMELMTLDAQKLLDVKILVEVTSLLGRDAELLHTFAQLFLPNNVSLESWKNNASGESFWMLLEEGVLRKLCPATPAPGTAQHHARAAAAVALPATGTAKQSMPRSARQVTDDDDSAKKTYPASSGSAGFAANGSAAAGDSAGNSAGGGGSAVAAAASTITPASAASKRDNSKSASRKRPADPSTESPKKSKPETVMSSPTLTPASPTAPADTKRKTSHDKAYNKGNTMTAVAYLNELTVKDLRTLMKSHNMVAMGSKAKIVSCLVEKFDISQDTLLVNLPSSLRVR